MNAPSPAARRQLRSTAALRRWLARFREAGALGWAFLLASLAAGDLGPIAPGWMNLALLVGLLAALIPAWRPVQNPPGMARDRRRTIAGWIAMIVGWTILLWTSEPVVRLACLPLVLWALARWREGRGRPAGVLRHLQHGLLLKAGWNLALATVPGLGDGMTQLMTTWTHWAGTRFFQQPLLAGPAGAGGGVLATAVCLVLARWRPGPAARGFSLRHAAGITAVLVAGHVAFLGLNLWPALVPQTARSLFFASALLIPLLIPGVLLVRRRAGRLAIAARRWTAVVLAALPALLALGLVSWPGWSAKQPPSVMFFNSGYLDWERPGYARFGPYESGMFGSLPDYLKGTGARCDWTTELTRERLRGVDILMVINPTNRLDQNEWNAVWEFVASGGALLVAGDHTDIMGSQTALNSLLAPVHIRFNFDSGFPARPEWRDCLGGMLHPVSLHARRGSDAVISVGATLDLDPPAFTLVRGRYGFADLGNQLNVGGAFLGDYRHQRGEQLGDVPLVAAARHGAGKVVVFGDTSPFQNAALAFSHDTFVQPLLRWLTTRDLPAWNGCKWIFAAALGAALLGARGRTTTGGALAALALIAGVAAGTATLTASIARDSKPPPNLALVDRAHGNRITLAPLQPDSVGPLTASLLRAGFLPRLAEEFRAADLEQAAVFVTTAPTLPFSAREQSALTNFVIRGGLVILNAGWEENGRAVQSLLETFGFDLLRVPLGPYPVSRAEQHPTNQVQFVNAWPVVVNVPDLQAGFARARETYRPPVLDRERSQRLAQLLGPGRGTPAAPTPPGGSGDGVQVLFQTAEGLPVVVARQWGAGSVVVIGDTLFLGGDNLETLQYYRRGNLLFLRHLFDSVRRSRTNALPMKP